MLCHKVLGFFLTPVLENLHPNALAFFSFIWLPIRENAVGNQIF